MMKAIICSALLLTSACTPRPAEDVEVGNLGRAGETASARPKEPIAPEMSAVAPANAADPTDRVTRGVVVETLQVTEYTYILLNTDDGAKIWAAIPREDVASGTTVQINEDLRMKNFTGREAGRTFEEIIFGTLLR